MLLRRNFSSINNIMKTSAMNVFEKSCYHKIDFKINEDAPVKEAIQRFNAFNIGCLAVTNNNNKVVGVCSERDYISKVATLDNDIKEFKGKDICTYSPIIIATKDDSLDSCMSKMLFKDIRHLLILDDKKDEFVGMISIKDLIKEIMKKNDDIITRLSDFKIGKGAFFGSE
jgi:predicted transcriptional regulator